MELILEKKINSSLKSISSLVVLAVSKLNEFLTDSSVINEIEISLAEAMTNIAKHAYNYDEDKVIEFALYKSKENIIIKIVDYSDEVKINFNKKLEYDPEDVSSLPEGGMGIFLINKCMDSVKLDRVDNKNELTMIKKYAE